MKPPLHFVKPHLLLHLPGAPSLHKPWHQLRHHQAARALTLPSSHVKLPIFLLVQCCSPQAFSVLCGPSSCLAPALLYPCSWSLEKSHPLPGTAWTTEQEVGAGDNYISSSVEVCSSDLVKNSFIHVYFGRMQRLEVLCVRLGSHFLTCLSFLFL